MTNRDGCRVGSEEKNSQLNAMSRNNSFLERKLALFSHSVDYLKANF
ncbi:hypothetical protein H6G74_07515 [Nostoc spongiaeforme FACHB-130]|uniref:Transposase n=1 Tax=Nostoc spongiaeforme FACHB-130 TaxID=1357510 RepID=A0ABR8FVA5_9NOSO|nr:hypothetical protein [Nostoc spongiaeforme]MBD2594177.1 hypothetical protein [Nostoc spongiaeforme FACHB-130]